jgi:CheY-like chemotaxis protein
MSRILLIEDEIPESVEEYPLVEELRDTGHAVDVALTGNDSLKALGSVSYDAVIIDIMLPHGKGSEISQDVPRMCMGIEILRQLRRRDVGAGTDPNVPVIVVTGVIDHSDIGEILILLGNPEWYLTKPVGPRAIAALLNKALGMASNG